MTKPVTYDAKINESVFAPGHLEKLIENIMNRTKPFSTSALRPRYDTTTSFHRKLLFRKVNKYEPIDKHISFSKY